MSEGGIPVTFEFSGGAELLFGGRKNIPVVLPCKDASDAWSLERVIKWLKEVHLEERPELFVQEKTVRPGILVLVNDTDWELLGELEYQVQANDKILFISTLHGG